MSSKSPTPALPVPRPADVGTKIHTGGCHCKKVRYEFEYPDDLYSLPVIDCNCSICQIRGSMHIFTWADKFTLTAGADDLTIYKFGEGKFEHRFCSKCGASIGAKDPARKFVCVKMRTIDGVDLWLVQQNLMPFDGRGIAFGTKDVELNHSILLQVLYIELDSGSTVLKAKFDKTTVSIAG